MYLTGPCVAVQTFRFTCKCLYVTYNINNNGLRDPSISLYCLCHLTLTMPMIYQLKFATQNRTSLMLCYVFSVSDL